MIRYKHASGNVNWSLWLFFAINFLGFVFYINFFIENRYLPSPFVFDKTNTFMDLFNTLYWAYDEGRYSEWGSVYPPLVFILLRFLNAIFLGSIQNIPEVMRQNSLLLICLLCITYLLIPIIVMRTSIWRDILLKNKVILYFLMIFSSPMLFALERGNVILLAPIFISLLISKEGALRAILIGLLINIKPYFALLLLYYVSKRDFKGFIYCTTISGLIFLITGIVLDNNFYLFFSNLLNFSEQESLFALREVLALPSSISAFSYVLKNPDGFNYASSFVGGKFLHYMISSIEIFKITLLFYMTALLLYKGPKLMGTEIICAIIILITNLGISVGGYSLIFYICLIPIFLHMRFKNFYLLALFILSSPLDVVPLMSSMLEPQDVFLSGLRVDINWTLGLGSFIRPVLNILLLIAITTEIYLMNRRNEIFSN